MLSTMPISEWMSSVLGLPGVVLVLSALVAIVFCFLGYVLFRALLVVWGGVAGAVIGREAVRWLVPNAGGMDLFVGGAACAVLLVLAAWLMYRLTFTVGVGACGVMLVVGIWGGPGAVWPWVFGAVLGVVLAGMAFAHFREAIILLFGMSGGFKAVTFIAALFVGGADELTSALDDSVWLLLTLIAVGMAVSVLGMISQAKLARLLRSSLTPADSRRRRGRGRTDVRPRFSRL
jgi:hypothetical protein